jgi:Holliday junction DNA helicase RuvA
VRLPGVGKKTAERLIIEMRDRLNEWEDKAMQTTSDAETSRPVRVTSPSADAISALIALGYKPTEASRWVHHVEAEGLSSEALIRKALQAAAS